MANWQQSADDVTSVNVSFKQFVTAVSVHLCSNKSFMTLDN